MASPTRQKLEKLRNLNRTSTEAFQQINANSGAPNIDTSVVRNAENLRQALGNFGSRINKFGADARAEKEKLDIARADFFAAEFLKDRELGLYSKAQVGEIFPDKSPIVLASITEAIGRRYAKDWTQKQVDIINKNPALINDTASRQNAIDAIRDRLATEVGDRSFFGAGAIAGMNAILNQNESTWAARAAAFHQDVQVESFYDKVSLVLSDNTITQSSTDANGAVTSSTNLNVPKSLQALDKLAGETTSINKFKRREIITDSVIAYAIENRDIDALNSVQGVLLGGKERVKISKARNTVLNLIESDFDRAKKLEAYELNESIKNEKKLVLQTIQDGGEVSVQSLKHPESVTFFEKMRNINLMDTNESLSNRENYEEDLSQAMITGDYTKFGFNTVPTSDQLRDYFESRSDINTTHMGELIALSSTYRDSTTIARSTESMSYVKDLTDRVKDAVRANGGLLFGDQALLIGNPEADIEEAFRSHLAINIKNFVESEGIEKLPENLDRLRKEAAERARETYNGIVEKLSNIQGMTSGMQVGEVVERGEDNNIYVYMGGDENLSRNYTPANEEQIAQFNQKIAQEEAQELEQERIRREQELQQQNKFERSQLQGETINLNQTQRETIDSRVAELLQANPNVNRKRAEEIILPEILRILGLTNNEDFEYLGRLDRVTTSDSEAAMEKIVQEYLRNIE